MGQHYQQHLFVCTNQKVGDKKCCANAGAADVQNYLKEQLVSFKLHGVGKVRVSGAGCLGRCKSGPCIVVYPQGCWYTYQTKSDVDRIIQYCIGQSESPSDLEIPAVASSNTTV